MWDYPRPPRITNDDREVVVQYRGTLVARSTAAKRVLETASPPTFYLPTEDVRMELLRVATGSSFCEWKGRAAYWQLGLKQAPREAVAWGYQEPSPRFEAITGYLAFYPALVECYVAGERVKPQPGKFYGGWITSDVVGPFKGPPGTERW